MKRLAVSALVLFAMAGAAQAAPGDIVFKGAASITSTTGCTGWNPANQFFVATLWVPVAGSANGPNSTLIFHQDLSGEAFMLANGLFTTAYKTVNATHIYTLAGTYTAQVKFASQSPSPVLTTTQSISATGSVKGWDRVANCVVNFRLALLRDLNP